MPERIRAAMRRLEVARQRRRRAALGPPLAQDDAALDAQAQVGQNDMAEVEAFVRDAAGQRGVDLVRAR